MTCSHAFFRAWRLRHVFASSSDWFIGLSASVVIGQSNYFGFGVTQLKKKHSIKSHSKYRLYFGFWLRIMCIANVINLKCRVFPSAWIGSLSVAFTFAVGPFAGSLINRFGCRAVSMVGCLTCAVSLTVASFAENLILLFVSYGVLGIGAGCGFLSSIVVIRNSFDKHQSVALGLASAGQGLGTMALSQVLQSLSTAVHWRNALRIVAGSLFLNSFFGILYDSKVQVEINGSSTEVLSRKEAGHKERSRRFTFHCSVWKVPKFLVLATVAVLFMFGRATNYVHLVRTVVNPGFSN